jgi:hypothetical protein
MRVFVVTEQNTGAVRATAFYYDVALRLAESLGVPYLISGTTVGEICNG